MRVRTAIAFTCLWVYAQSGPVFEVASVKPSDPNELGGRVQFLPGGRFTVENCTLRFILQRVFGIRDFQIVDAPKWISDWNFRFDIQAKGNPATSSEQMHSMAQALLADRFQLKVHRGTRKMPVYAMVAAKGGFRLHAGPPEKGGHLGPGGIESVSPGELMGRAVLMEAFIRAIERDVDRPILDRTGYTEPFDFHLEWAPEGAPTDDLRPVLATALQQLGLRLESQTAPVEVLIVDRVEKPSAN